jgi:hypothetical protein
MLLAGHRQNVGMPFLAPEAFVSRSILVLQAFKVFLKAIQ